MKFEHYLFLKEHALKACAALGGSIEPETVSPVLLAYIGDAVFTLYTRLRLLETSGNVRVVSDLDMKIVSARYQNLVMESLALELTAEEENVVKRGRNAKTPVPKSATVHEYRMATAFEALLGWLLLTGREARLAEVLDYAFKIASGRLAEESKVL